MVFSSQVFVFIFLPVVFVLNTAVMALGRGRKGALTASNILLLVSSLVFYSWGEPVAVLLLIGEALVCYIAGLLIEKYPERGRLFVAVSCVLVLGALCFFKYSGFLAGTVGAIAGNPSLADPFKAIALPLGISFFSFQLLSYVIDVYRRKTEPCRSCFRMLLYASFFPQLVAGPIVKYVDIAAQFDSRSVDPENVAKGIRRFIIGLAKKMIIANTVALIADSVFALEPSALTSQAALIGAFSYTLQIYYDFSGYSDMAIGMARMFGFTINENFLHPYASLSVKEFWRRWHVSLSSWFRDYLYIPLGGNRKGKLRTALNKLTVFFFTGLWHGANFTFILWGLWHGMFLFIEEFAAGLFKRGGDGKPVPKAVSALLGILRFVYVAAVVMLGFVMFRSDTVSGGFTFIGKLFSFTGGLPASVQLTVTPYSVFVTAVGIAAAVPWMDIWKKICAKFSGFRRLDAFAEGPRGKVVTLAVMAVLSLALFAVCALALASSAYNPFIYFRF